MKYLLISIALILIGIVTLNMLPVYVGGGLIILGIVMLVDRRWPEKCESDDITQSKLKMK